MMLAIVGTAGVVAVIVVAVVVAANRVVIAAAAAVGVAVANGAAAVGHFGLLLVVVTGNGVGKRVQCLNIQCVWCYNVGTPKKFHCNH